MALSDITISPIAGVYAPTASPVTDSLAQSLCLPLVSDPAHLLPSGQFLLVYEDDHILRLYFTGRLVPKPIYVDFTAGASDHRRRHGGGKSQLVAKAAGIKGTFRPQVLDLTAGLGQDGFVLATLGCTVQLVERVPVIAALLENGLKRARLSSELDLNHITSRLSLTIDNALNYLQKLNRPVDLVYLDPMFPNRDKSAQVKKNMRAFQSIVGGDEDAGELLPLALEKAKYRVVVKRPRKAPSMDQQWPDLNLPKPNLMLAGKSTRFDIYTLAKMP